MYPPILMKFSGQFKVKARNQAVHTDFRLFIAKTLTVIYNIFMMIKEEKQMRLFVAIKFSPEIEKSLTDLQDKMKENHMTGNYTNCQNLHLTLAFIGEYNSPNKVMKALSEVEFEPFEISLGETIGNFGDILWVGLKRNFKLMALDESVLKTLENEHIPFDRKPFKPHITITRNARIFSEKGNQTPVSKFLESKFT